MSKRRWQRVTIRVIGWTFGLFWLSLFFGLTDLSVPLFFHDRPEFYENYLVETGWGVLFTFFAGLPMCFLGTRPEWISAALISAAAAAAVLIAGVVAGQPLQLIIVGFLLGSAAAVWLLDRSARIREGSAGESGPEPDRGGGRRAVLGLAVVAVPPAVLYAAEMIQAARTGIPEPTYTNSFDHWPIQAASVLVIPLATATLAFRCRGWRPMTFVVASGTAWFGTISIFYPDHVASWGTAWGWTGIAWAAALGSLAFQFRERLSIVQAADSQNGGRTADSTRPYSDSMREDR